MAASANPADFNQTTISLTKIVSSFVKISLSELPKKLMEQKYGKLAYWQYFKNTRVRLFTAAHSLIKPMPVVVGERPNERLVEYIYAKVCALLAINDPESKDKLPEHEERIKDTLDCLLSAFRLELDAGFEIALKAIKMLADLLDHLAPNFANIEIGFSPREEGVKFRRLNSPSCEPYESFL